MITISDKFKNEIERSISKPAAVIGFVKSTLSAEAQWKAHWDAALSKTNIDTADPAFPNEALIAKTLATTGISQTTFNNWRPHYGGGARVVGSVGDRVFYYFQSFTNITKSVLSKIKVLFALSHLPVGNFPNIVYISLTDNNEVILDAPISISSDSIAESGTWIEIDYSAKNIMLNANQVYKIMTHSTYGNLTQRPLPKAIFIGINEGGNPYSGGSFRSGPNVPSSIWDWPNDDIAFEVLMLNRYQTTGSISIKLDLGQTPIDNGEWVLSDIRDNGSSVSYQAWSSTTGVFAGEETNLGTIVDGTVITDLKRYYKITATLTASADNMTSPHIQKIKANFDAWDRYCLKDSPLEYKNIPFPPIVMSVPQLQYQMDILDGKATISKVSIDFLDEGFLEEAITNYFLKNNEIVIYIGFDADGWTFTDYIPFWRGNIASWKRKTGIITLECADWAFLSKKEIPVENAQGTLIPLTYDTASVPHPMDIILDILKNKINMRDAQIHDGSFNDAKASAGLTGWKFIRTISEPTDAWELIKEINVQCGTVMVPREDGKLYCYQFSLTSSHVAEWGNNEILKGSLDFDARMDETLLNQAICYYGFHVPLSLTGTGTFTQNSQTVTGSGTVFTQELSSGMVIQGPDGRIYTVQSIASNTSLTLETVYAGATAGGQTIKRPRTENKEKPAAYQGAVVVTDAGSQTNYKQTLIKRLLPSLWLGPDDATYSGKTRATDIATRVVNWAKDGIAFANVVTSLEFVNSQVGDFIRLGTRTTLPRNLLGFTWTKWVIASKTIDFKTGQIRWGIMKVPSGVGFSHQLLAYSEWLNAATNLINLIITHQPTELLMTFSDSEKTDKLDTLSEWNAFSSQSNLLIEA